MRSERAALIESCITRPSPRRRVYLMSVMDMAHGRSSDLQAAYLLQLSSSWLNQCFVGAFVPAHRCGAVPEFYRIPFSVCSREADTGSSSSIGQINTDINEAGSMRGSCGAVRGHSEAKAGEERRGALTTILRFMRRSDGVGRLELLHRPRRLRFRAHHEA